jgi:hypothetical protein
LKFGFLNIHNFKTPPHLSRDPLLLLPGLVIDQVVSGSSPQLRCLLLDRLLPWWSLIDHYAEGSGLDGGALEYRLEGTQRRHLGLLGNDGAIDWGGFLLLLLLGSGLLDSCHSRSLLLVLLLGLLLLSNCPSRASMGWLGDFLLLWLLLGRGPSTLAHWPRLGRCRLLLAGGLEVIGM